MDMSTVNNINNGLHVLMCVVLSNSKQAENCSNVLDHHHIAHSCCIPPLLYYSTIIFRNNKTNLQEQQLTEIGTKILYLELKERHWIS